LYVVALAKNAMVYFMCPGHLREAGGVREWGGSLTVEEVDSGWMMVDGAAVSRNAATRQTVGLDRTRLDAETVLRTGRRMQKTNQFAS
jgi:hypothetical protein